MILYLVRTYGGIFLVMAVLLMLLPTMFGSSPGETVLAAFFWSGLVSAPLTYWEFRRRNLWPLYVNLRLPRLALLALLAGCVESCILLVRANTSATMFRGDVLGKA